MKSLENISSFKMLTKRFFTSQKYQSLGKFVQSSLPKFVQQTSIYKDELIVNIHPSGLKPTLQFLKLNQNLLFTQLVDLTCVDYPSKENRFSLVYLLLSIENNLRIILKTYTDEITPVDSCTGIYKSADWMEREVYDMFGVYFNNHPDLRRILTDYG